MSQAKDNLRSGFTTGACAAAAAKGALLALLRQQTVSSVTIRLLAGQEVPFALHACSFTAAEGRSSVIKDAGDDPDVTHQAEICARVWRSDLPGVAFQRGLGVGLVTKPGLPIPPGEPAINPAPRQLITETIQEVLENEEESGQGVTVEISVPRGEELARKTFNPRLGIVGGISILGTTGIVVPYSTSAWLASVVQQIDVVATQGCEQLVLTVGARGERFARQLFPLPEEAFVQIGPFFGDALRRCAERRVRHVVLISMMGKLAKFAAGHESVHSTASAQDFAFLAEIAREAGAPPEMLERIQQANTAQEVSELALRFELASFHDLICARAWNHARSLVSEACSLAVYLSGQDGRVLARCP
jgi:cobalt-precorrin-5B (C1)-methyltransferase